MYLRALKYFIVLLLIFISVLTGNCDKDSKSLITVYNDGDNDIFNFIDAMCTLPLNPECKRLNGFLRKNLRYMLDMASTKGDIDEYWYQIRLQCWQLKGMVDAYHGNFVGSSALLTEQYLSKLEDDVFGLYLLQLLGDLSEILKALDLKSLLVRHNKFGEPLTAGPSCSALIKLTKDNVYLSHVTWSSYNQMLRVLKHYNFPWKKTASDSSIVPGQAMSFSSYPSMMSSMDDFYLMNSKLVAIETTIGNYNDSLWRYTRDRVQNLVFEPFRVMAANRLARNGPEWVSYFERQNSGTYNNQWMIFDANLYKPGFPLPKTGVLTVAEQLPGIVYHADVTDVLERQTYWSSYNLPYFPAAYNLSGVGENKAKFGDWYDYDKTARAEMFRRDHTKVTDMATMHRLMRYNDFKHDPLSRCNCTPPYTAENAISARSDLNDPKGKYALSAFQYRTHGATDVKITDYKLIHTLNMVATSGPTYDNVPPFQWSKLPIPMEKPKMHPDLWMFTPILTNFTDYLSGIKGRHQLSLPTLIPVF